MRILIAEDNAKMAGIIQRGLREAGHAADIAATGDTALARARSGPYEALVLDVLLPGRSGFEVCRELRAGGSELPILMLTARDGLDDRVEGLDAGADDYLTKPFAFSELLARLRALSRRGGPRRPSMLAHGQVVMEPAARSVTLAGRPVELTVREMSLLEAVLERPGELVTRTYLYERVWDEHYDGLSNVVDVYIGRLRRKLSRPDAPWPLRTLRGAGYILEGAAGAE
ncbi:MAG: response regulator transcription factor [Thermoleophilia bacterium]